MGIVEKFTEKTIHLIVTEQRYKALEVLKSENGYMNVSEAINDVLRKALLHQKTSATVVKKKFSFENLFSEPAKETKKIEGAANG